MLVWLDNSETLLTDADGSDRTGGVAFNHDGTVDNRGSLEIDKEDWQNRKTYESYERSYTRLENN